MAKLIELPDGSWMLAGAISGLSAPKPHPWERKDRHYVVITTGDQSSISYKVGDREKALSEVRRIADAMNT